MKPVTSHPRMIIATCVVTTVALLVACGGATTKPTNTASASKPSDGVNAPSGAVLPVTSNPINNTSTTNTLRIDKVNAEDNVDPMTGKDVPDHLEIALANTGTASLGGVEVFYTITDTTTGKSESYYAKLPADFVITASGKRIAHFDSTGQRDHFPINKFDLYRTSKNPLDVKVTVSAVDAAVQTVTIKKDAGGAETAD